MTLEQIKENLYDHIMEKYGLEGDPDYTTDVNLFDYGFLDSMGATEVSATIIRGTPHQLCLRFWTPNKMLVLLTII